MDRPAWPLAYNTIRRARVNNTFGRVRDNNTRDHQGWDLVAPLLTPCYAVADGTIVDVSTRDGYGDIIVLQFAHAGRRLYAAYAHLSAMAVVRGEAVTRHQYLGLTGATGNATSTLAEDQHLHFEIRTAHPAPLGMAGRIDPAQVYGLTPLRHVIADPATPPVARR